MKFVQEIDRLKWSHFIHNHSNGNIFQTPEMYEVFRDIKNCEPVFLALIDRKNEILGVLLAQIQKFYSEFLSKFTARSVILGGPIIKDNDTEIGKILLKKFDEIISKKVIYSQFRNLWCTKYYKDSFSNCYYNYEEHLNILIDLTIGEEALWKGLNKSRKEGIRKARRNGLIFEASNSKDIIPTFYNLLKMTYKNAKLPYPSIDFFYSLSKNLSPNNIKFFTLRKENKFLVILVALVFNRCLYAYYIGRILDNNYLKMKPVDSLYWEVLLWGLKNGCKTFDWLGAGKPNQEYGVRRFKLQFGGKLVEFGRYEKVYKPFLMKLGKFGLKLKQKFS